MSSGEAPTGSLPIIFDHMYTPKIVGRLINSSWQKFQASLLNEVLSPEVKVKINGHEVNALIDTGATLSCLSQKTFRKVFAQGKRPSRTTDAHKVRSANGSHFKVEGTYQIPFSISGKNYDFPTTVFANITSDMVLGIDFMHASGLSYDAGRRELFRSDKTSHWKSADMELNEDVTLNPISNAVVTINVITRDQARPGRACTAVATVNSNEHVITGGPALIQINKMGQAQMEIFNCNAYPLTIKRDSIIGMVEQILPEEEDSIAQLNVEEMTATLEKKIQVHPEEKITKEKEKFIREMANLNVPDEYRKRYTELLLKHHFVISSDKNDLGQCKTFYHDIQLRDEVPVFVQQFKIQDVNRKAVEDHVKEMLKLGCIRPSTSKYNSPIFIVKKKDGGIRIVQDFRALNKKTLVDKYSMRDVQECIDEIGRAGSKIFSTLDLTSGFWQMLLNPDSQKYTAFTVPGLGTFEWNSSPMGLLGAPGSFQRLMEIVIHNLKNIIAYIDDLLVHTKTHEEQLDSLDQLFTRLNKNGLKINLKKSFFGCEEVSYLGFRLTPNGVLPGIDKLKAVREALPPSNVHEVRQFMGLCNFFRGHVRNFAQISAPLNALTRKEDTWKQGPLPDEAQKAFKTLQMILTSNPIIHYPQPELTYALVTNAGVTGYGATLAQVLPDGSFQTVSYASRKLKEHERNYAPFLMEMGSSVWAMDHFSVYLKGRHFLLYTDNKPIASLNTVHTKTLNRFAESMKQFDFEIMPINGNDLPADLKSENLINVINCDNDKWRQLQENEPWINQCKAFLLKGTKPSHRWAENFTSKSFVNKVFIENDLLWLRYNEKDLEKTSTSLVVPCSMAQTILEDGQGEIFLESDSMAKCKEKILQHYWWPTMDATITEFLATAPKPNLKKSTTPNTEILVDIFQMPNQSDKKKNFILCITDKYTQYAELIAIKDDQEDTVAEAIFISWMMRYGIPSKISINEEEQFCENVSDKFSTLLDVNATFKPLCLSRSSVANTKILEILGELSNTNTLDWEAHVPSLMFCYNTSFQRKINASPYFLTYGQNARQPSFNQNEIQQKYYGESMAAEKFNTLLLARQLATKIFEDQSDLNNEVFNRQMAPHSFQKDNWVMFKGKGPYQIVQLKSHNNAILKIKNSKLCVNIEHLSFPINSPNISFQKQGGDAEVFPPKTKIGNENENEPERKKRRKVLHSEKHQMKLRSQKAKQMEEETIDAILEGIEEEAERRFQLIMKTNQEAQNKQRREEESEAQNLINAIWHRDNPIKLRLRKIIQATPKEIIEKRYPGWNEAQIINFNYSGDINIGPDDPELISIGEAGSLPSQFYQTFFPQLPQVQQLPVQLLDQQLIGPNPFGQLRQRHERPPDQTRPPTTTTGQATPEPPEPDGRLPQGSGDLGLGTHASKGQCYDLERIRPELRNANFNDARNLKGFNDDEQAYFRRTFDLQLKLEELQQEERIRKENGFRLFKRPKT